MFIDEKQVENLERRMNERGYLEGSEMATPSTCCASNDLIWSFVVNNYLMGKDPFPFDLLYWNSDSTRMPATMHSFYLRNMYLKNLLGEPGRHHAGGRADRPVEGQDAGVLHLHRRGPHRAVEVDLPGRAGSSAARCASCSAARATSPASSIRPRRRSTATGPTTRSPATADEWLKGATAHPGSWWDDWQRWMQERNGNDKVAARVPRNPREDAPGSYVKFK